MYSSGHQWWKHTKNSETQKFHNLQKSYVARPKNMTLYLIWSACVLKRVLAFKSHPLVINVLYIIALLAMKLTADFTYQAMHVKLEFNSMIFSFIVKPYKSWIEDYLFSKRVNLVELSYLINV